MQVLNPGVSGDMMAGGAVQIDWTLTDNPEAIIGANNRTLAHPVDPAHLAGLHTLDLADDWCLPAVSVG